MGGRAIVRVNHVAGRATAGAIVAWMIVRAHKVQEWIVQAGLLQVEKDRVNAVERAETSLGEAAGRLARFFERIGIAQLQLFFPSALEDAQNVARLGGRKSRQRINERQ